MKKLLIFLYPFFINCSTLRPICEKDTSKGVQVCKLTLTIAERRTSTARIIDRKTGEPLNNNDPVPIKFKKNGKVKFGKDNYFQVEKLTPYQFGYTKDQDISKSLTNIIYGDGATRTIVTVNDQYPGPNIIVPENALMSIKIINKMKEKSTVVHFHGLTFGPSWYYDGYGMAQCPIQPNTDFTYLFQASPAGTNFYHGHLNTQSVYGLFGSFIIEKENENVDNIHPLMISEEYDQFWGNDFEMGPDGRWYTHNGQDLKAKLYVSTMLNGRGRYGSTQNDDVKSFIPYQIYNHKKGMRFVIIHAGYEYQQEFSIQGHKLIVYSIDGSEIEPYTVNSIIITPAERYMFGIEKIDKTDRTNFLIRVDTIAEYTYGNTSEAITLAKKGPWAESPNMDASQETGPKLHPIDDEWKLKKSAFAILSYKDKMSRTYKRKLSMGDYTSLKNTETLWSIKGDECIKEECKVLSCIMNFYVPSKRPNTKCIKITDLKASKSVLETNPLYKEAAIHETVPMLLTGNVIGPSINGHVFKSSAIPLSLYGGDKTVYKCGNPDDMKPCTNILKFPTKTRIRFLFSTSGTVNSTFESNSGHNFHFHGHKYKILYEQFPKQNKSTGISISNSIENIKYTVSDKKIMINAEIIDLDKVELNHEGVLRDVHYLPDISWGLAEVYLEWSGFWYFHCHFLNHMLMGMAAVIQVGDEMVRPTDDVNWPTCGSFKPNDKVEDFYKAMTSTDKYPFENEHFNKTPNPKNMKNFFDSLMK